MRHKKVAIIGAGIAGATLANRLLRAGYHVTLFEKSRGTGGRQSSCRIGKDSVDIGAPWYEPKTVQFRQWLNSRSDVIQWKPQYHDFSEPLQPPSISKSKSVYLSTPRQSSLTQNMIRGAMLCTSAKIIRLRRAPQGIRLIKEDGDTGFLFDAVFVTTPAAQAVPLLSICPQFRRVATSATYTSSWVTVISLAEKSTIAPDIISGDHPVIYRAVRDSSKPGRNSWSHREVWVLEANSEWSKRYSDSNPSTIGQSLIKTFKALVKQPLTISGVKTHQWLYRHHQSATSRNYLWDPESNIGVCSDWLNNTGNEGAWISANALADQLLYCSKPHDLYSSEPEDFASRQTVYEK